MTASAGRAWPPSTGPTGLEIELRGVVQGVGFRPFVYRLATEEGLRGTVSNDSSGVTVRVWGSPEARERFVARLETETPPGAVIDRLRCRELPSEDGPSGSSRFGFPGFRIAASERASERLLSIPPDLATCRDCLRELFDPVDRRYRYPFVNCTHCGPRFTIANDVPYDRSATTMATFEMCVDCRREYEDAGDRRYHAQPIACPACGPRLELLGTSGERVCCDDPIAEAAHRLLAGEILAIKGLGGYHLACRADDDAVVERLRDRKRREAKPFAVMVPSLEAARGVAAVDPVAARLLSGAEAPIVLLPRLEGALLAAGVAPGLDLVGLLLPYTPLHHLLLHDMVEAAGNVPLVMTSGNLSEHPIVHRDDDCLARLGGIADAFLVHDRDIEGPADDSVVRIVRGEPLLLRRSRGYTPRAILLRRPVERPILAVGGQLKNTFCFAVGDSAYLGPHLGDLDDLETYDAFCREIARLESLLGVEPEVLAHDLHPDYLSTHYALERAERRRQSGRPTATIAVQHHQAHLASALADLRLEGPALGVIFDGTGFGPDGSSWGGELLWGDELGFDRVATLRPIRLAGGERAIREPWRLALELLMDAEPGEFAPAGLDLFERVDAESVALVREMLERDVRCPLAHGAGRYFDAFGALTLGEPVARYESELALRFERLAASAGPGHDPYPFALAPSEVSAMQIDLRPSVGAMARDLRARMDPPAVAARCHRTLAVATARAIAMFLDRRRREARWRVGDPPTQVVLSGGCFANALLAEQLDQALAHRVPHEVVLHQHRNVPPGDGGLALGQLVVAAAAHVDQPPAARATRDAASESQARQRGAAPCV